VDTPADIRAKIAAQLMQILSEATITQRMTELGALVAYKAPNEFAAFMQNDFQKWQRVTAETGIKAKN
jgi:tripartite-type tricarboxylate transporter receptor subunit TctC